MHYDMYYDMHYDMYDDMYDMYDMYGMYGMYHMYDVHQMLITFIPKMFSGVAQQCPWRACATWCNNRWLESVLRPGVNSRAVKAWARTAGPMDPQVSNINVCDIL